MTDVIYSLCAPGGVLLTSTLLAWNMPLDIRISWSRAVTSINLMRFPLRETAPMVPAKAARQEIRVRSLCY